MLVQFDICRLKLEEIQKEDLTGLALKEHELKVISLIKEWISPTQHFFFHTSGSTGRPKKIKVDRKKIEYSCASTFNKIDPANQFRSTLLCLNPAMIGGAMVVFRALMKDLDLRVTAPQADPSLALQVNERYDLVSLVPLQLQTMTDQALDHFHTILVGGAALSNVDRNTTANIYSTFGMTETVSHFALKRSDEAVFECTGDATVVQHEDDRLQVKGTITDHQLLQTNDIIEFVDDRHFRWLGRSDFIINSGGLKLNPEAIEAKLYPVLPGQRFIVSSLPDDRLQNRVILLIEGETASGLDVSALDRYERPKEVHFLPVFAETASGKVDRIATRRKLIERLGGEDL